MVLAIHPGHPGGHGVASQGIESIDNTMDKYWAGACESQAQDGKQADSGMGAWKWEIFIFVFFDWAV